MTVKFYAVWPGELSAGLGSGEEEITITFRYGPIGLDGVEYFREILSEYFDNAKVYTEKEWNSLEETF